MDETRPYLQGARLTAWELKQAGVPHTLIPDMVAGSLMARGEVDVIVVGADRIAANGDTANKVGTYTLAVLAARHGIPFYVCAPMSSVDLGTPDGAAIPIEDRPANEVTDIPRRPDRAGWDRGSQPVVRRHARRADHRDRHGGGRAPGAVRTGAAGRDGEARGAPRRSRRGRRRAAAAARDATPPAPVGAAG